MNVDNCTILQLQTKDQLTITIRISFCNYQVAGESPNCTIVQLKTKDLHYILLKVELGISLTSLTTC